MYKFLLLLITVFYASHSFSACPNPMGGPVYIAECSNIVGDGIANDGPAINAALAHAASFSTGVEFPSGKTYLTNESISIRVPALGSISVPMYIDGNGSSIVAGPQISTSASLVFVESPDDVRKNFRFKNFQLDGRFLINSGFELYGGEQVEVSGIEALRFLKRGVYIHANKDGATIENELKNVVFRNIYSHHNGQINSFTISAGEGVVEIEDSEISLDATGDGFLIYVQNPSTTVASNIQILSSQANNNLGNGFTVNGGSVSFIGSNAEQNNAYGYEINRSDSVEIMGTYTEGNHLNKGVVRFHDDYCDSSEPANEFCKNSADYDCLCSTLEDFDTDNDGKITPSEFTNLGVEYDIQKKEFNPSNTLHAENIVVIGGRRVGETNCSVDTLLPPGTECDCDPSQLVDGLCP